jgi:tRNA U34 5-methylaminomethyl-2-thiouridine-forming methyltransferase MnmC
VNEAAYKLVRLRNGTTAVHATAYGEAMHPGAGPAAEAEALYVGQLRLRERLRQERGELVVWDVGLGAAANALAVLRATRDFACPLHLVSFDNTLEPLAFALAHAEALGYFRGYEPVVGEVLAARSHAFTDGKHDVRWEVQVGDFPAWLERRPPARRVAQTSTSRAGREAGAPHAILFDPFSPKRNSAMWTLPLFTNLFRALDPERACALATYSRSTLARVALLRVGFFVGRGRPSGVKEETTVAANRLELLDEPLAAAWLHRARKSGSAEPLHTALYRQQPLSAESWAGLRAHPQFAGP